MMDKDLKREDEIGHLPVMLQEVLEYLDPKPGMRMLDCTTGRGGHAEAILPKLLPGGEYIGLDVDEGNIAFAGERLKAHGDALQLKYCNFGDAGDLFFKQKIEPVDLLMADLGFASNQMDDPARGFSFSADGPLDMRLDHGIVASASDLLQSLSEPEIADLIYELGEERLSRKIARFIVEARHKGPIKNTAALAELCVRAYGPRARNSRIHPATRTFMALRIAVNDELGQLDRLLASLPQLVKPGGRALMISFHSLEDRRVKQTFRSFKQEGIADVLTKKPLVATDLETRNNPRSRSAKIRVIQMKKA